MTGRSSEAHLVAVLSGQIAQRNRQMRLADARGTEKDNVLGALDEGEAGELMDLPTRHTRCEAKVKAVERFNCWEAGHTGEHLARPGAPRITFGA